jgi:methylated-DNA-[protein]-cysteine S-methyltransferase
VTIETPLGPIGVEATDAGICRIRLPGESGHAQRDADGRASARAEEAARQISDFARGRRTAFDIDLDWVVVDPDDRRVLETLCEIAPFGTTVTYGELGRRSSVADPREVGVVMARNPLPIVVPCHRVVAADGLGGYGGGLDLKRQLLELEGVLPARLDLGV